MSEKRALVTGASEGIGRAFAKQLAQEGYAVTLVARNEPRLRELLSELSGSGHQIQVADLSKLEGVKEVSKELSQNHYQLLVNNAGFGVYGEFHKLPLERLQDMTRVNCDALVALAHAYLQRAEKGDALINVSSALAFLPFPTGGLYAATKAFVTSLSESLWYQQKDRGVYVMGLCPGLTRTLFQQRARDGAGAEHYPSAITQTPEQVVSVAMKALKKRKSPTVISGVQNFTMASLARFLPRKTTVRLMGAQE